MTGVKHKASKKPESLRKGDMIGIMAPSSRVDRPALRKAVRALEARGFKVYVHPQTYSVYGQSAGRPENKAAAFHDLIKNPDIKAIFAARGGNRAGSMLEHLDFRLIAENPKIIMGYSDITALLTAINKKTGLITFHGPMSHMLSRGTPKDQLDQCFNLLSGKKADMPLARAKIVKAGKAEGRLIGGNLSLVCSLMGTPWQPDFKNDILFLEDVGEELSRIDRMFLHLRNTGVLHRISGLVLGGFTEIKDTGKIPFGFTLAEIVQGVTWDIDLPVVMNAPFGHGRNLYTLPVGANASLKAEKRGALLKLAGPAISR